MEFLNKYPNDVYKYCLLYSKLNLFFREEVKAELYIKDYAENPSKMPSSSSASSGIIT